MSAQQRSWSKYICAVLVAAISGCAVRDVPAGTANCDYRCIETCPPGFECSAGFCVKPGFAGTCEARAVLPETPPRCSDDAETLTLTPLAPIQTCVGQAVDVLLEVTGDDGPFSWFSYPEIPGLVLEQTSSPRARLRGTLRQSGSLALTLGVRSATGCAQFQALVDVGGTPVITTTFPDACVGQPFELELTATGAHPDEYHWSVDGVPELSLNGSRLSGKAPLVSGQHQVSLSVRDERCPSAEDEPITSELTWNVKAPGQCPRVTTAALPAPCAGIPYSQPLTASDGSGSGYAWSVLEESLPEGLDFDAARGVVHGTATGASPDGFVEVSLTDSAGQRAAARLDVSLRRDCWLAYVGEAPARLHVRDVFSAASELVLPQSLPPDEAVRDMKFSPNGSWIAFRAGLPDRERLYVYPTESAHPADATAISFACPTEPCAVLDYVWSESSTQVAVVLGGPSSEHHVSGVDVAALSEPWPLASTVVFDTTSIGVDYLRDLVWIPQGRFAFVGGTPFPDAPEVVFSISAGLTSGVQSEPAIDNELRLRGTRGGWVALSAFSYSVTARSLTNDFALHGTAWISPSGSYVATTDNATLSLYGLGKHEPVAVSAPGDCAVIVAWAPAPNGAERIGCSDGSIVEPNGQNLRVFDYWPGQRQFDPARGRAVPTNANYVPGVLTNTHRMFSPDATWLLIGAPPEGAVLAAVPMGTTSLPPPIHSVAVPGAAELQFAPDGRALLIYDQYGLRRSPVPPGLGGTSLSTDSEGRLVPPPALFACEEGFWAAPDNWCGAPRTSSHFAVSADSNSVLLEAGDDSLWLTDLSATPQRAAERVATRLAPCPVSCAGVTYAFQP